MRLRSVESLVAVAACAGCAVELAALAESDASTGSGGSTSGGAAGAGGIGGGSGAGGVAGVAGSGGDASADAVSDVIASDAPPGQVLCAANFEGSKCFAGLGNNGNAHCGPGGAISGSGSGTLEGGNNTSISMFSCGVAPPDVWLELVYRRDGAGSVTFRVGQLLAGVGAQVRVGEADVALIQCLDGKNQNQPLPSELSTPYVITLHIGPGGTSELWHRKLDQLSPRGAPQAALTCSHPTSLFGWMAIGPALTTIDDIRIATSAGSLLYP